jgi:hypothetical protein
MRLEVSERDYVVATKSKKSTVASISAFTQTELGVRTAASSPTWGISKAAVAVGQSSVYPEADWVRERGTRGVWK